MCLSPGGAVFSKTPLLVTYWGQNGAGPAHGPANYEKPLIDQCRYGKFDVIAVSFLHIFFGRSEGMLRIKKPSGLLVLTIRIPKGIRSITFPC